MKHDHWNRCDVCGKFIPLADFPPDGPAVRELLTPDAEGFRETWQTLCRIHATDDLARILENAEQP